ncbi:hypothetical protein [Helicobacter bizzozeronii]|uniref:hypothetical protein n=1 Tax=Helicobacter bizzozeronii TaxID=56877 RepID=UPI0013151FC0|nr:hypothetical protein [Helicobacter bizzozeronii]
MEEQRDKISIEELTLSERHPLAKMLRNLEKKGNEKAKEILTDVQRKLDGFEGKIATLPAKDQERLLAVARRVRYLKPDDSCVRSPQFLEYLQELSVLVSSNQKPFIPARWIKEFEALLQDSQLHISMEDLRPELLNIDKVAIGIEPYAQTLLDDPNEGHWDLYPREDGFKGKKLCFKFDARLNVRTPKGDVKPGEVAIDFGTKSTIAAYLEDGNPTLLSIGAEQNLGNLGDREFENPTIIAFRHHQKFLEDYGALEHRPLTELDDLGVSHGAFEEFKKAEGNDFYRFFYKLKQWAGAADHNIRFNDEQGYEVSLKGFMDCDFNNPVEFYAYLLGRYINNMNRGVYLKYFLSYPVKYEEEQALKIRESFEKGLRKSLPAGLDENQLQVRLTLSEPAAYAISALQEFGFYDKVDQKGIYYGIFDFGGGTTDFDFGIFKESDDPNNHEFDLCPFTTHDGMRWLGGENLLELLAYELYIQEDHLEQMREHKIPFVAPNYDPARFNTALLGDLITLAPREGRRNLQDLVKLLRPFVENLSAEDLQKEDKDLQEQETSKIESIITLKDTQGEGKDINLTINYPHLLAVLRREIEDGVKNFFTSLRLLGGKIEGMTKLHIFLGGNASRSPLLKAIFLEHIDKEKEKYQAYKNTQLSKRGEEMPDMDFELWPPLGTPEADEIIKRENPMHPIHDGPIHSSHRVTCKTGVVFGLLEGRERNKGGIQIVREKTAPAFKYHIGFERRRRFEPKLHRDRIKIGEWVELDCLGSYQEVEFRYTDKASAFAEEKNFPANQTIRCVVSLDRPYPNHVLKICAQDMSTLKIGVFNDKGELVWSEKVIRLDDNKATHLN